MTPRVVIGVDETYPYSKVVKCGGFVYVKSQVGIDASDVIPDDTKEQTRLALEHIEHALELAGTGVGELLKINVYMQGIDDRFASMNEAYDAFFDERGVTEPPARTTVGVPLSWPELHIQMDAVAAE
jgi:2-iminobutanoate/2-iminopropanoate deaminase